MAQDETRKLTFKNNTLKQGNRYAWEIRETDAGSTKAEWSTPAHGIKDFSFVLHRWWYIHQQISKLCKGKFWASYAGIKKGARVNVKRIKITKYRIWNEYEADWLGQLRALISCLTQTLWKQHTDKNAEKSITSLSPSSCTNMMADELSDFNSWM